MRKTFANIDLSISTEQANEVEVLPGVYERRHLRDLCREEMKLGPCLYSRS